MALPKCVVLDGNEAVAYTAYKTNEINIIYPITPASPMGEHADIWSGQSLPNIWGATPLTVEMQSEGGVAGALHGAIQTGALATTFTSSQGLLLMIPNMYRIAAELTPTVFHIATRILAYQGMSIYCDHSDVMAARSTGFALFCSSNVQEAHDFALIAQATSLQSQIPFLHFFDGFRTSHEVSKIELITDDTMRKMLDEDLIFAHRARKLSPENPIVRAAIQNQDIVFQARESANIFYDNLPPILEQYMQRFAKLAGRSYHLLDYFGAKDAERIIIAMGSATETIQETISYLQKRKEKIALIKVRLFRPFPKQKLLELLPASCRAIAVLDRTKESGAAGEPLFEEVASTLLEAHNNDNLPTELLPKVIGGRFGIGSKEFTPAMVKAIFDELKNTSPKNHFSIGIDDDISHTHLNYDQNFNIESEQALRCIFFGLGADGTVGANKNSVKIIGEETAQFVQAYFVYNANKSGAKTTSHLRFSFEPIQSAYLVQSANFIGCHQYHFIDKFNILEKAAFNATFLLNSIYDAKAVWQHLPRIIQEMIIAKKINFYVIDAYKVAKETGMGNHINTIMQTCFFILSNMLPKEVALEKIKSSIKKTYSVKGEEVTRKNFAAVDQVLANLFCVEIPKTPTSNLELLQPNCAGHDIIDKMLADSGDNLPVSAVPVDGSYPIGTTCLEKRNIAQKAPVWNVDACIQCGQCSLVCPHSVIRVKRFHNDHLQNAPIGFKAAKLRDKNFPDHSHTRQIYLEDCTACGLCAAACPVELVGSKSKAIELRSKPESLLLERQNIDFFEKLPNVEPDPIFANTVHEVQYLPPFFEFCSACAGCGEAPYIRLLSQLYGDRLLIADACGCSLVYGCTLPTMPWTKDRNGRGPAFSGSLFEDNAEFGYGYALTADMHRQYALELLEKMRIDLGDELVQRLQTSSLNSKSEINMQRKRIAETKTKLAYILDKNSTSDYNLKSQARHLLSLIDYLVRPSIWAVGGDGWAYDIGFGGLDHVIASNRKINILVLDTEVYSNTGGQASKATPRGSVAKFATQGKDTAKKDLGLMAINYGNVYVASIALGANPSQAIQAFKEAESYPGPALIIAFSHCIAHGIDMHLGLQQQKLAVKSGYWLLYRYNPQHKEQGLNPMRLDSDAPSIPLKNYMYNENRFRILLQQNPKQAGKLLQLAEEDVKRRWHKYKILQEQYETNRR